MATAPDPTYITAAEVQDETLDTVLAALEDTVINKLIKRAESQIDAFCRKQPHHPDDDNEDRVFPRDIDNDIDGNAEIPVAVHEACLLQVEHLYRTWYAVDKTAAKKEQHNVKSYGVTGDGGYNEVRAGAGRDDAAAQLCAEARSRLSGYRKMSATMTLSGTSPTTPPLSSRDPVV